MHTDLTKQKYRQKRNVQLVYYYLMYVCSTAQDRRHWLVGFHYQLHYIDQKPNYLMTAQCLYKRNELMIIGAAQADEQASQLLQQTVYGTKGVRYRQTGQEFKIHQLHNPFFFHLYNEQELIGFYCLDERPVGFPTASVPGYYGRYLAVRQHAQGNGYGQLLKTTAVDYVRQQVVSPYLFYSYIEAKNTRSMAASLKENFASVAQLKTFLFRRFTPKLDSRFRIASSTEPGRVWHAVQDQYAGYGFQNFLHINYQNQYFTLEENGQLLAGVQANPIFWELTTIPGTFGPLIKHVAPHIPGLRRFFNPDKQAFVALEGVYLQKDRRDLLPILLESVLAYFNIHTAIWQIDEKDHFIQLLTQQRMGRFSHFQSDVITHLMVKAVDLPETIQLDREPAYISCFDYS